MSLLAALDFRRDAARPGPLLPRGGAGDRVLVFVVTILAFLACVAALGAAGANRAAGAWRQELVGSASVLVRPSGIESPDSAAARATEVLAGVTGVEEARMLERREAESLLRPWLGTEVLADLPIPRLIALELDAQAPPTAEALGNALRGAGLDGQVDDHSLWMKDIMRAGRMARIAAVGAAVLLALAAGAVTAHAARAAIGAYAQPISILHDAGATDRQIAGLISRRFAWLGFRAAVYGAAAAALLGALLRLAGGAEGLVPMIPLAWGDLALVLIAPAAAGLVGAISARTAAMTLLARTR